MMKRMVVAMLFVIVVSGKVSAQPPAGQQQQQQAIPSPSDLPVQGITPEQLVQIVKALQEQRPQQQGITPEQLQQLLLALRQPQPRPQPPVLSSEQLQDLLKTSQTARPVNRTDYETRFSVRSEEQPAIMAFIYGNENKISVTNHAVDQRLVSTFAAEIAAVHQRLRLAESRGRDAEIARLREELRCLQAKVCQKPQVVIVKEEEPRTICEKVEWEVCIRWCDTYRKYYFTKKYKGRVIRWYYQFGGARPSTGMQRVRGTVLKMDTNYVFDRDNGQVFIDP